MSRGKLFRGNFPGDKSPGGNYTGGEFHGGPLSGGQLPRGGGGGGGKSGYHSFVLLFSTNAQETHADQSTIHIFRFLTLYEKKRFTSLQK